MVADRERDCDAFFFFLSFNSKRVDFFSLECVSFILNVFILDVNALSNANVMHINVRNS